MPDYIVMQMRKTNREKGYSKVFLRGCMDMREKQISSSVIKFEKENWE